MTEDIEKEDRVIIFDTETTGISPEAGHRIIEVGCIELINRKPTGKVLHFYVDPEREVPEEAVNVHGLNLEELMIRSEGKKFADHAKELYAFFKGAIIVAHKAPFDIGHLDAEYRRLGWPEISKAVKGVTDTLVMANRLYPQKRNNLDMLCGRLGVDNSGRDFHGALLDAELLTDVYLNMTTIQNDLLAKKDKGSIKIAETRNIVQFTPITPELSGKLKSLKTTMLDEHSKMMSRISEKHGDDVFTF